ncbi:MAG: peptidoglycan DD-metalloendopeptidase family protein [Bacteroidales bacterium]|nr:peptidoglycan DD-metalloendopeptidase family protein [Bacteroidales bacterium]MBN2750046.1 peptidoglycan DD-metalloendopeptidase family protein [Bacteroidales bacterium]
MAKFRFTYLLLFALLFFGGASAQSLQELNKKKGDTEEQIKNITLLIESTQKEKELSTNQISLLKRRMDLRKQRLEQLVYEISLLEKSIDEKHLIIQGLNADMESIKKEYARLIQYAWKNRSYEQLIMFILSSEDFNQAYKRMRFYQQLLAYRKHKADEIVHYQNLIGSELNEIQNRIKEIEQTRKEREDEFVILSREEGNLKRFVSNLQSKEKELREELQRQNRIKQKLASEIKELIAEEARKAASMKAKDKTISLALAKKFSDNRGKLPSPVKSGVLSGEFGEHWHPVLKGVKVKNNGVDITVNEKSTVYSVFEGEVKKVFTVPGSAYAVIIRHGNYLTVYSNLSHVDVKVGDTVKTYQEIGTIGFGKKDNSVLHFELWEESKLQNPAQWIIIK